VAQRSAATAERRMVGLRDAGGLAPRRCGASVPGLVSPVRGNFPRDCCRRNGGAMSSADSQAIVTLP
jgi:hypothetical protein